MVVGGARGLIWGPHKIDGWAGSRGLTRGANMVVGTMITSGTVSRNPCQGNGYPAQMLWNDTIFIVCDPNGSNPSGIDLGLALGLGLGLGIPFLIGVAFVFCRKVRHTETVADLLERRTQFLQNSSATAPQDPTPFSDRETVESALTAEAFADFCNDNLTENLKGELMEERCRQGRNLTEFARFAVKCKADTVATYVERLYPGNIPLEIRHKASMPRAAANV